MPEKRKDLVWIKRIAFITGVCVMVYFMVMTVVIPVSRFKIDVPEESSGNNKVFRPDLNWQLTVDDSIKNTAIDLASREAFLLSRIEMTKSDSISLTVSLKDSVVSLVMQGVSLYSSRIQSFHISHAFKKTDPFVLSHWLSKPFVVDTYCSSIPKFPVLYKKAPKDTIEAMNQLEIDPLKDNLDPVYFRLNLDRNMILIFEQAEELEKGNLHQYKIYRKSLKELERKNISRHLFRFQPIEFVPKVRIVLDKKAARVIYRAIPVDALVAVQLVK